MASKNRSASRVGGALALAIALLCAAQPSAVSAQDALAQDAAERRTDLARTLFQEGVQLVQEERWEEAEARFRQALENRDAPAVRYNLASVLVEQNELPEAAALIASVLADETTPENIRALATELRTHVDERAGYVRVEVSGAPDPSVALDGYTLPDRSAEVPLAPGAHVATASRGELELARAELEIATGEHRVVQLDAREPEPEAEAVAEAPVPAHEEPLEEQWWFWTAIGGGVVVVAVVIGVVAATADGGVQSPVQGNFEPGVLRW